MNKTVIDRLPLSERQKTALRNARITQKLLADAVVQRDRLTLDEKAQYVEALVARQPQLAGTIVVLQRLGVDAAIMEPLTDLLLMVTIALENAHIELPHASEDLVDLCYEHVITRITQESDSRLSPLQRSKATQDYMEQHPEQWLLAYAFSLTKPLQQSTEEDRIVVMLTTAVFNFVEVFTELLHPHWGREKAH
jgi:hypothetical protein